MKTSIETINGELCTVILYGVGSSINFLGCRYIDVNGVKEFFKEAECLTHIATALPALHERPNYFSYRHILLWHYYAAKGLFIKGDVFIDKDTVSRNHSIFEYPLDRITHAEDVDGNRVEVAIKGE